MGNNVVQRITDRAVELNKSVVLPEATDERVIRAAREITDKKYARITLLGNEGQVRELARSKGVSLEGVRVLDPQTRPCAASSTRRRSTRSARPRA